MSSLSLELLNETHNIAAFDCGNHDLNDFLKEDALPNQKDRLSVTRLIFRDNNLAGFFTITPDTLHKGRVDLSDKIVDYPYEKYPAIKLARLAVDKRYQQQGIGKELLLSFFRIANLLSLKSGGRYLTVDAKSTALPFYEYFGFRPVLSKKIEDIVPMYLDICDIISVVEREGNNLAHEYVQ